MWHASHGVQDIEDDVQVIVDHPSYVISIRNRTDRQSSDQFHGSNLGKSDICRAQITHSTCWSVERLKTVQAATLPMSRQQHEQPIANNSTLDHIH
jgi:hypothetical protein